MIVLCSFKVAFLNSTGDKLVAIALRPVSSVLELVLELVLKLALPVLTSHRVSCGRQD